MTKRQKELYMLKVVSPKFRELFTAYDPRHFEKVGCRTCHGHHPRAVGFKMPSPDLPTLPASEEVFMATVMKEKPQMVKFMAETVVPEMARLLGKKPFDPAAPDKSALSCETCHGLN